MSIPPTTPTSVVLRALLAACLFTPTYLNVASAQELPLPVWEQSGGGRGPDASLFPQRGDMFNGVGGDIFQGGNARPEIVVPSSMFDSMPSAPNLAPSDRSGVVANLGGAVRNMQTGNTLGAFQAVGAAASQGPSAIPAVGQVMGNAAGSLPGGVGQIARTVQAGAQVVGAAAAVGSTLGQFQRGGSGTQGALGAIGNIACVGQGQSGNLQGILQGLGGGAASAALGNGIGAGPFGQFVGQNNQILQGLAFIALLQRLMNGTGPFDMNQQFNRSNTGESAKLAYQNLMQQGINDSQNHMRYPVDDTAPPLGQCGRPQSLTPAQQKRWNEQFNRMNRLIKGSSLEGYVPADGAKHGITTGSSEEWAAFYANLGVQESGNQNTVVGDQGKFVGNSNGIYQLSPLDYANYRGDMQRAGLQPGTTIDGKPAFTIGQLQDPEVNSRATLAISENLIRRDGAIGNNANTGMARYWGPLRRGWSACG